MSHNESQCALVSRVEWVKKELKKAKMNCIKIESATMSQKKKSHNEAQRATTSSNETQWPQKPSTSQNDRQPATTSQNELEWIAMNDKETQKDKPHWVKMSCNEKWYATMSHNQPK